MKQEKAYQPSKQELLDAAKPLIEAGCRVIPCKDKGPRTPEWNNINAPHPSLQQIDKWIDEYSCNGIGIVCGSTSENRYVLDFESIKAYDAFKGVCKDRGIKKRKGFAKALSGKGVHIHFKTDKTLSYTGHPVLAKDKDGGLLAEILAERFFVACPPSYHPSGKRYIHESGDLLNPTTIDVEEAEQLIDAARQLNEYVKPEPKTNKSLPNNNIFDSPQDNKYQYTGKDVRERFDRENNIETLLQQYGYEEVGTGKYIHPNKDSVLDGSVSILDNGCSHHFGTADPLRGKGKDTGQGDQFSPFGLYCEWEHNGDRKQAIKTLFQQYGMNNIKETDYSWADKISLPTDEGGDKDIGNKYNPLDDLKSLDGDDLEAMDWLWEGRIALGEISLLAGHPSTGKSHITYSIAANVSTGRDWVDKTPCPLGDVLIISAEEHAAKKMKPRLKAAGADRSRVKRLAMVSRIDEDGKTYKTMFSLKDVERLRGIIEAQPSIKLVVIDPIGSYLGGADSHRDSDVRDVLSPLSDLAEQYGVAILIVAHFGKAKGRTVMDSVLGSKAFSGYPRSVLAAIKTQQGTQCLAHAKPSEGEVMEALTYDFEKVYMTAKDGRDIVKAKIVWTGSSNQSADDILAETEQAKDTKQGDAEVWLRELLADGNARNATDIFQTGSQLGYGRNTLYRAADAAGVKRGRVGNRGGWTCRMDVNT